MTTTMTMENLNEKGVCCSLYVSYPKYRNRLSLDMFRLNADGEGRNVLKGPGLNLLGDEIKEVAAAERRARAALQDNTLPIALQIGLHFCPIGALAHLLEEVEAAKAAFREAAAAFIARFDDHVETARARWAAVVENQTELTEDERAEMLQHGHDQIPTTPPRLDSFVMSLLSVEIRSPGVPSLADVDAREAAAADLAARTVRDATERRMRSLADTFVDSCRDEIAGRISAFMQDMRAVVREGKPINKRTMQKTRTFLASIRGLNFFKDADIAEVLGKFESVCFPHGIPDTEQVTGMKSEDYVRDVSDTLDEILASLSFDASFSRRDGGMAEAVRDEAVRDAADVVPEEAVPAPGKASPYLII